HRTSPQTSLCLFFKPPPPTPKKKKKKKPLITRPSSSTVPELGVSCPLIILKKVLFPAPLGPIKQRSSPSASVKLTLSTATMPPKCRDKPFVWSSGLIDQ